MMKNLAIIPARGGSKRLLKKNLRLLNGKPLVQYTLEAVVDSGVFDTVILSSDDDDILGIAGNVKGVTPQKREAEMATDKRKVIDLIKDIAERDEVKNTFDTIGLFLPTCPFRTARHIKEGFALLTREDYSVVSITDMSDPVQLTLSMNDENLINPEAVLSPSPLVTGQTRSQDFEKIYRVNGGFYIAWLDKFRQKANFFDGRVKGYYIDKLHSVDIDYELDFEWAEYLLRKNHLSLKD
ncbi:cytidylyltransferase domain-containing protein [Marinoscillum sp. 108]|uniref:acylneuraminate cytidylyltransferase family protein n=1 Tax=Marinoscillum sp. 108 TaxID=2653151 RepID=UPI0012F0331F|nr:acylneuraminate cytidylyltransferase family protein [Marinoscillum sp. 108]VXD10673.1 CMP-N-acetlyneuraminic acid synthetase [Marinoscillum sp. 108]